MNQDVNVLALVKGKERYLFLYEDSQQSDALRALGRAASNPELSFTWYDAAVLSKRIRTEAQGRELLSDRIGARSPAPKD
ncbi:hypothetical protein [Botrimarina sp.]|uniref:hypothetical protein n=1 Tax=Botrimarina sp. TaxID=2795802 RepID=UPI0032EBAE8A